MFLRHALSLTNWTELGIIVFYVLCVILLTVQFLFSAKV